VHQKKKKNHKAENETNKISNAQNVLKIKSVSGHGWLIPVIPATQQAEIRRITVQRDPGQTVQETLSPKKIHHKTGLGSGSKCRP
jgi:hypothetical protein